MNTLELDIDDVENISTTNETPTEKEVVQESLFHSNFISEALKERVNRFSELSRLQQNTLVNKTLINRSLAFEIFTMMPNFISPSVRSKITEQPSTSNSILVNDIVTNFLNMERENLLQERFKLLEIRNIVHNSLMPHRELFLTTLGEYITLHKNVFEELLSDFKPRKVIANKVTIDLIFDPISTIITTCDLSYNYAKYANSLINKYLAIYNSKEINTFCFIYDLDKSKITFGDIVQRLLTVNTFTEKLYNDILAETNIDEFDSLRHVIQIEEVIGKIEKLHKLRLICLVTDTFLTSVSDLAKFID